MVFERMTGGLSWGPEKGRAVCRCPEMGGGQETSTYLTQHPKSQVYLRGKDKEMKLTGPKKILGSQRKVMSPTVLREG